MNSTKIIISPKSVVFLITFTLLILFVYQIREVLLLLFGSFVIASALYPVVDWMNKKINRGLAVGIVYLIGFLLLIILCVPFFSVVTQQTREFMKDFPTYWNGVQGSLSKMQVLVESTGFIPDYGQMLTNISAFSKEIVNQSINLTINVFAGIAMLFAMAFIVLFMLLDKQEIKDGILKLFPFEYREKTEFIAMTISKKVGGYVRGQLLLMLLVGILTSLSLALIGLKFAFLLGIIAAILEIVPIVGPILSAVPAIIIALSISPWYALYVLGVYLVVQRIENSLLAPLILGKFLELHPIIIISAVLVAASTLGIFGVILSPAIAASIYVLIQELYIKKINEKETVNV